MSGAPVTIVADAGGGIISPKIATVSPLGEVRVENPASQLFLDTFDTGTLDTVNKWATSSGTGGANATNATGATVLSAGTTLNGFSKLTSQIAAQFPFGVAGQFRPSEPGFLLFNARINVSPKPATGGTLMHWGFGISPGTPTIAAPMTQFIGFELGTNGKMAAVVYQTTTRVLIQDLSVSPDGVLPVPQPTDTAAHKYFIFFRGDIAYWCIDDKDNVVAQYQTGANGPDINTLPLLFQCVSNAGVSQTMQINAATVGDTAHTGSNQLLNNGIGFDLQTSNQDSNRSLLTLTAQGTGTVNSADFLNINSKGVKLGINITVLTAGTVTINLQGKDIASGQYYTIFSSFAFTATGFTILEIYPGITPITAAATGGAASATLPRTWRIQAVVATGPATATIGAALIV